MNEDIFIPFIIFFSIFGYAAWRRYMEYKETVALADKGMVRPQRVSDGKDSLRWGIVLTALGLALTLGAWPMGLAFGGGFPLGLGPWLLPGLMLLFVGLGLVLIYLVTKPDKAPTASSTLPVPISSLGAGGPGSDAGLTPAPASGWAPLPAATDEVAPPID